VTEIVTIQCNKCLNETHHLLLYKRKKVDSEVVSTHDNSSEESIDWWNKFEMLECKGCHEVTLRKSFWFSEEPYSVEITFYPPRAARKLPHWFNDLRCFGRVDSEGKKNFNFDGLHEYPTKMWADLLEEIYAAIHGDSRRLAAMGARALLDSIMETTLDNPPKSFKEKLEIMEKDLLISKPDLDLLKAAIDVGSAAAHRAHNPSRDNLNHVMDIAEGLLRSFMLNKAKVAEALSENTPSREKS
jgi:hypothetical protein